MGSEITCGTYGNVCEIAEYPDCGPGMMGLAPTSLETRASPTDLEEALVHSFVLHSLKPGEGICCELTASNRCRWQTYFAPQVPEVEPPPVKATFFSAALMMDGAQHAAPEQKVDPNMPWYAWPIGIGGMLLVLYSLMKAVTDSILPEEMERRAETARPRALDRLQQTLQLPPQERGMTLPPEITSEPAPERVEEISAQMRQAESGAFSALDEETLRQVAREIVILKDSGALSDVMVEGRVPSEVIAGLVRNMAFEGSKYRLIQERAENRDKVPERKGFLEGLLRRGGK